MKKAHIPILISVTLVFIAFILGFFLGRNYNHTEVSLSVPAAMQTAPPESTVPETEETTQATEAITFPININTATLEEFMALPGIGEVLAQRILAYREENGSFEAVEGLMNVEGIGEKRMEELFDLVTIGG